MLTKLLTLTKTHKFPFLEEGKGEGGEAEQGVGVLVLGWKLLSFDQSQVLSQRPYLASDWLHGC